MRVAQLQRRPWVKVPRPLPGATRSLLAVYADWLSLVGKSGFFPGFYRRALLPGSENRCTPMTYVQPRFQLYEENR